MSRGSSTATASGEGIGFVGLLTLIFITLKLINKIDWSWFWILSPLIFSTGIFVLVLIIIIIWGVCKR
jgi:hypothetical protein